MASEITPHYFAVNEVLTAEKLNKLCAALIEVSSKLVDLKGEMDRRWDDMLQQINRQGHASYINIDGNMGFGKATTVYEALQFIANVFAGKQAVTKLTALFFDAVDSF